MAVAREAGSAHLTIVNDGSSDNHIFHLYVREKDAKAELWDGARSGTQAAIDVFNADEVGPNTREHAVRTLGADEYV